MIAKYWKKIGLIIILVACLFNIIWKLVNKTSFIDEIKQSAQYVQDSQTEQNTTNTTKK